jgi:hypothetical protein
MTTYLTQWTGAVKNHFRYCSQHCDCNVYDFKVHVYQYLEIPNQLKLYQWNTTFIAIYRV